MQLGEEGFMQTMSVVQVDKNRSAGCAVRGKVDSWDRHEKGLSAEFPKHSPVSRAVLSLWKGCLGHLGRKGLGFRGLR